MKVLIFGGTGFVGRNLINELLSKGIDVLVVTRDSKRASENTSNKVQFLEWDNISGLHEIDAVVNLAGESIGNRRWSKSVKQEILESRLRTTRAIVTAINDHTLRPKILINASAVGYYGAHQDEVLTEDAQAGNDFLAQVCCEWESEAYKVHNDFTKVATIRIGVVLGNEGALNKMLLPFKFFAGGPIGTGNQWLSWIHIKDLTRMINFIIEHKELTGPINATAPEPLTMRNFCSQIGEAMHRPSWLPVPEFVLRLALGQMSEMLLNGQCAVPNKICGSGFEFRFPKLESALKDILENPRSQK